MIWPSLLPQTPPFWYGCLFSRNPNLGELSFNGLWFYISISRASLWLPDGVVGLLKVRADVQDLLNEVFNADNVGALESSFDHLVRGDRDSLLRDLHVSSLVKQHRDSLSVRVATSRS